MTPTVVRLALRRTLRDVKYVRPVRPRRATGLVRSVYTQLERDFGLLAPPIGLHSPSPGVLAASWAMLRESLVAAGVASRADKEVVAAAVSQANACPYCVEVHGMALASAGRAEAAAAIADDRAADIGDPATRRLARWAAGGDVEPEVGPAALSELIAVAVSFQYLNRMVEVFLGRSPLPDAVPESARATTRAVLGRFLRPGEAPAAGSAVDLLPAAGTPADFGWAAGNPVVAEAFARAAAAIEAAAERVTSPAVRAVVLRELASWDGRPPGISRVWTEPALVDLPEDERPLARLALLTALCPSQVDDQVIEDFRRVRSDDAALVELAAWASLSAARTLGARMPGAVATTA
ncbi:carboxymuconolactone decarboxylase family protein [Amycolatopsis sp. H20-H5]|uniref:carboxymuconolactone decarboxylase family protein n=1 Tax=Amycolatopsis sp. H20-H5 TaxID=3046309 RepID=UPI002DBC2216|nr:carboxymuconolactone decarboxylase family protein [Amycolatopsis sp. H20-H5]MEC3976932.1 carboxymuconolactone decarboxylase family protein [Amycolatopsis sp. H20-H5]